MVSDRANRRLTIESPTLSVSQAAQLAGRHRNVLLAWIASGRVAASRSPGVRGSYRIARAEVERLLDELAAGESARAAAGALERFARSDAAAAATRLVEACRQVVAAAEDLGAGPLYADEVLVLEQFEPELRAALARLDTARALPSVARDVARHAA